MCFFLLFNSLFYSFTSFPQKPLKALRNFCRILKCRIICKDNAPLQLIWPQTGSTGHMDGCTEGRINLASIENTLKSRLISPATNTWQMRRPSNCIVQGQERAQKEPSRGCCNAINFMARLLNGWHGTDILSHNFQ